MLINVYRKNKCRAGHDNVKHYAYDYSERTALQASSGLQIGLYYISSYEAYIDNPMNEELKNRVIDKAGKSDQLMQEDFVSLYI